MFVTLNSNRNKFVTFSYVGVWNKVDDGLIIHINFHGESRSSPLYINVKDMVSTLLKSSKKN